ncbi:MAG: acetyl-CoA C-acetyltransferase [Acidimicrobiia bacterium]|nr:acetyl-CoA C-acetyltransferase [Acidimicrobiia bacterium]
MSKTVIVSGARTPIGKMQGALAGFSASDLGGIAIKAALERAGLDGEQVDYVILGQVLQAGQGQNPARPAAVGGGIPMTVPSITVNKVCLSGINALALADQLIRLGECDVVVAGGMESMTNAPYLLKKARAGYRYGNDTIYDSLADDGLYCTFDQKAMGHATDEYNSDWSFGRAEQDEFSARSHELAAAAQKNGAFEDEIVPVEVPQRKGDPVIFDTDEGVRPGTTAETLGKLPPAFIRDGGTITAGNASQISDGACALVLVSEDKAKELGLPILGEIVAHGQIAGAGPALHSMPAAAITKALEKAGLSIDDIDLFEVNEAFAAVSLAALEELGVPAEKLNVNGGAVALGHPIGMSGARIVLHGLFEQRRRGGGLVAAGICGGGGQGDALIVRALP